MSSALLENYVAMPRSLLRADTPMPADLYIYMPANKNLLMFRKKSDSLTGADIQKLAKIEDGNLVVLKSDYEAFINIARGQDSAVVAADPNSPAAASAAKSALKSLNMPPLPPGKNSPQAQMAQTSKMLENSFVLVKDILTKCQSVPSAKSFLDALKDSERQDPLQAHCRHVSALSTLGLIALGTTSIEELADIAFAGLIHDLGLSDLPKVLLDKHLAGVPAESLNSSEKIGLMRHIDLVFEQLKKTKTLVPDGARRIIEQHHENFSGTGFKGLKGKQIYRSARVLRIMDELVTYIHNPDNMQSIKDALKVIRDLKDPATGEPNVDLEILDVIEKVVLS